MELFTKILSFFVFLNALSRIFMFSIFVIADGFRNIFYDYYFIYLVVGILYLLSAIGLWKYKKWGAYILFPTYFTLIFYLLYVNDLFFVFNNPDKSICFMLIILPLLAFFAIKKDWHKFTPKTTQEKLELIDKY